MGGLFVIQGEDGLCILSTFKEVQEGGVIKNVNQK